MSYLKRLTPRHWAWLHFKIMLGVFWAVLMFVYTPYGIENALGRGLVTGWLLVTIIGCLTSVVGLVMTVGDGKVHVLGVSVELVGLILFSVGPVIYFFTQLALLFNGDIRDRLALVVLAYAMCSVFIYRFVVIVPRYRQEARDETKEV